MLVGVEHGHALAGLHLDGQDLALEPALRLRACGAAMALHGELILHFAGDAIFTRHMFRSVAHIDFLERVAVPGTHRVDRNHHAHPHHPADASTHTTSANHSI